MFNWCVFACEEAVFGGEMCHYATLYAQSYRNLPDSLDCCIPPIYEGDGVYNYTNRAQCMEGVYLKDLSWLLNQHSRGRVLDQGALSAISDEVLQGISFPCFGIQENNNEHCVVICGVKIGSDGVTRTMYWWDPWLDGEYRQDQISGGYDFNIWAGI